MSTVKDRNCMDLTEAEDIKKRLQEYMEELYKKDLHDTYVHLHINIYKLKETMEAFSADL